MDEPNLLCVQLPCTYPSGCLFFYRGLHLEALSDSSGNFLGNFLLAVVFFLQPWGKDREGAVCSACGLSLFLNDGQDSCPVTSAGSCSH